MPSLTVASLLLIQKVFVSSVTVYARAKHEQLLVLQGDVLVLIADTSGAAGQGSVRVGKKGPTLSYTTLH